MINLFMYDSSVERCAVLRIMFPLLRFWNSVRLWFWYSLQHQLFVCVFFRSLTPFFDTHPKKNAVNYAVSNAHAIRIHWIHVLYNLHSCVFSYNLHIVCSMLKISYKFDTDCNLHSTCCSPFEFNFWFFIVQKCCRAIARIVWA